MTTDFSLFLLITAVALITTTTSTTDFRNLSVTNAGSPAPSPVILSPPPPPPLVPTLSPPPPNSPPPHAPPEMQQQQLKNIIDALIGAGDFAAWANMLFNPNSSSSIPNSINGALIPTTATMFVPGNDALSHLSATATGALNFDPYIIPYHILLQRLTFSELQLFKTQTRLPTLLPSRTVIITNNSPSNFTIDDSLIIQPDIYNNDAVCVHGIANILDYTTYGEAFQSSEDLLPPPPVPLPPVDQTLATPVPEVLSSTGVIAGADFMIPFVTKFCIFSILYAID